MNRNVSIPKAVLGDSDLRPSAKILFGYLAAEAEGGRLVFESADTLGNIVGMSTRAVGNALRDLEAGGWIEKAVSQCGRGRPRGWRVLTDGADRFATVHHDDHAAPRRTSRQMRFWPDGTKP